MRCKIRYIDDISICLSLYIRYIDVIYLPDHLYLDFDVVETPWLFSYVHNACLSNHW